MAGSPDGRCPDKQNGRRSNADRFANQYRRPVRGPPASTDRGIVANLSRAVKGGFVSLFKPFCLAAGMPAVWSMWL